MVFILYFETIMSPLRMWCLKKNNCGVCFSKYVPWISTQFSPFMSHGNTFISYGIIAAYCHNKCNSSVNCNSPYFFFNLICNENEGNSETRILLSSLSNSLLIQLWILRLWWGKAQDHPPRIRCNCPLKEQLWKLPHSVLIKYYWISLLWDASF